jgi:hypothetical protein
LRQGAVIDPYNESNTALETFDVVGQVAQSRDICGFTGPRRDGAWPGENVYDPGGFLKGRSSLGKCDVVPIGEETVERLARERIWSQQLGFGIVVGAVHEMDVDCVYRRDGWNGGADLGQ